MNRSDVAVATLDAGIAAKALALIDPLRGSKEENEYRSASEGLPALLRSAGIARTVAFLKARGGAREKLADHIAAQLQEMGIIEGEDHMALACAPSPSEHRSRVRIAMRIALWHKRVAQTRLKAAPPQPSKSGAS